MPHRFLGSRPRAPRPADRAAQQGGAQLAPTCAPCVLAGASAARLPSPAIEPRKTARPGANAWAMQVVCSGRRSVGAAASKLPCAGHLLHPLFDNACRTSHPHLIPGCCYSCFGSSLASCSQSHSLASGSSRGCVVLSREGVGLKFTRELVWVHRFAFSLELPVSLAPSPSPRRAAAPR